MKIHSLFTSINGEVCSPHQGSLTTFIRTFGCNCRCSYCDSKFSYTGTPIKMRVRDIVKEVKKTSCKNVTITGGEPLLQKGIVNLIRDLQIEGFNISVETNGSIFIPTAYKTSWVADYKLPSSGCESQMNLNNYINLNYGDFIKFVVSDRTDFDRALEVLLDIQRICRGNMKFAFSPAFGKHKNSPETLAQWMIENPMLQSIGAIYNLQIHKILKVK